MPKISVIIPVYNAEDYLERCLDSVIHQILKDIEIICVDDCSVDNSLDILKRYQEGDDRIKIIHKEKNEGESKARNTGIEAVRGEYIAFIDNDDEIDLDFYEKLYNRAVETGADIIKAKHYQIEYDGRRGIPDSHNNNELIEKNKMCFLGMWWTAIYKTSLIKENNIKLPENYLVSGDRIFLQKALLKANFVSCVDETYYYHYAREDSGFSRFLSKEKIESAVSAIIYQIKELNENNVFIENAFGYDKIIIEQFNIFMTVHNHNNKSEYTKIYSDNLIEFYVLCKRKDEFLAFILQNYPCLYSYIVNFEKEKLKEFLIHLNTTDKFKIPNLRAKMSFSKMKKILIVGKNAYLAENLVFDKAKFEVDKIKRPFENNFDKYLKYDFIINFCIQPECFDSILSKDDMIDVKIANHIKNSKTKFVFLSSRKVYGNSFELKEYKEEDELKPYDFYSKNKYEIEKELKNILNDKLIILRTSNIIGNLPHKKTYKAFTGWLEKELIKNKKVIVTLDKNSKKDFITKEYFQNCLKKLIEKNTNGVFNLGAGFGVSTEELLENLVDKKYIEYKESNKCEQFVLNCDKIHNFVDGFKKEDLINECLKVKEKIKEGIGL